jgi:hypothetical protein
LPTITIKLIPPLNIVSLFHYGDYDRRTDSLRAWVGGDFEDTCWHEAVHAAEARLGLRHNERRAEELARHLAERYELPDLSEDYSCPSCDGLAYFGLEVCRTCGEALEWPYRIPRRR